MRAAPAVAFLSFLLLAGCAEPAGEAQPVAPQPSPQPPPPEYTLTLRASEEAADGAPIAGAEVEAYPVAPDGKLGAGLGRRTGADGTVRFAFRDPTTLALRVSAPGWTTEGTLVRVGTGVAADGALASDRDLFLPLFHDTLRLAVASALVTSTALDARPALADLAVPQAYLDRLSGADVAVRWDETPTQRADLAAGLAWEGHVFAHGEPSGLAPAPGSREASWSGDVEPGGARLSAAAILNSAAVGDVPLSFEVTLRFSGQEPPGLPAACHSSAACLPLPPLSLG